MCCSFFRFALVVCNPLLFAPRIWLLSSTPSPTSPIGVTPSPTITATPSPTPSPHPVQLQVLHLARHRVRRARRDLRQLPAPLPTATATASPTATATAQPTATHQPIATRNPNATQTPTSVPPTQTTGNGGGTGLPPTISDAADDAGRWRHGSFLLPVIIGLLATLAIAGAGFLGFVLLRQRMLPADPLKTNLPPSGARPWSRFRQGSMHGGTNMFNDQTLADTTPPFGGAATWAIRSGWPEQGMNFAQSSQPVPFTQAQPQRGFSSSGLVSPQAQPYPQMPPNSGYPQAQPYPPMLPNGGYPQAQSHPQSPPIGGYSAREPLFPQQPFPPQQGFPAALPNAGFYPANSGNNDIALASNSANTPSTGMGNIAPRRPSPLPLRSMDGMDSSHTDDIPAMPGIPGMPDLPNTPRPHLGSATNSEEFPSLDDPFLRNTLKNYMQKGKSAQEGKPWDEA